MAKTDVVVVRDARSEALAERGLVPDFTAGHPVESLLRAWASPSGKVRTGIWECQPGTFPGSHPVTEWCYFITGRATFTAEGCEPVEAGPGSIVVFPAGWTGTWEIHETLRKVFVKGELA